MTPAPASAPEPAPVQAPDAFVHCHVHSEYSILDGLNGPSVLVRTAGNLGQPAIAITDHGRLSAIPSFLEAIDWYNKSHAERHVFDPDKCHKKPKPDDTGCHSATACAHLDRCPKGEAGSVPAEGHATLPPLRSIIGIETYVAHNGRTSRVPRDTGHLILLARNATGWANLRQLASLASTEGFYSKPRIDWELLEKYHEGLIALSSCLGSHLANIWKGEGLAAVQELPEDAEAPEETAEIDEAPEWASGQRDPAAADALAAKYRDLMGPGGYYLEIQWHNDQEMGGPAGAHDQADFNAYLLGASERLGIPMVMTNDLHYAYKKDAPLQEIMMNVAQRKTAEQILAAQAAGKSVMHFDTPDYYLKSRREMEAALSDWYRQAKVHDEALASQIKAHASEWLDASLAIAASVEDYEPFRKGLHFPNFPVPAGETAESFLASETHRRAPARFANYDERTRRLVDYELQCIQELGFAAYFLITADFCDYARREDIEVGLGRGSAPGSVITYVLGITDLDPIKWDLTVGGVGLTRFLNPTVLYRLDLSVFGQLPEPWASQLAAIDPAAMETEIAAELNARTKARNEALAAGLDEDGKPLEGKALESASRRWRELKDALVKEWRLIKQYGLANEEAKKSNPFAKDALTQRGSLTEPLWRWLRATKEGAPAGHENACFSVLAKFLGLTDADVRVLYEDGEPLFLPQYEFTHSRKSMPDIDIDFEPGPNGREKVMQYVTEKYGADHVCQIATFGTMLAKSAIKDVARIRGFEPAEANELSDLVPKKFAGSAATDETGDEEAPKVTLHEMIESDDPVVATDKDVMALRARMAADPRVDEVLRLAARLEGAKRTEGTHACGVLITPDPVTDYVSVRSVKEGKEKSVKGVVNNAVQAVYDGPTLTDKLGLVKVDFLGLENLSVNKATVERIFERTGKHVNWRTPPDDDQLALGLLRDGFTEGIFQFSQPMGTGVLRQMKPRKISDLIAATALARPGPAQYIPDFIEARAHGQKASGDPVFDAAAKGILDDTYGILVYQEQVMLLSIALSGFTLPESDGLRKATAKKDRVLLASWRDAFVDRAVARHADRTFLEHYWDQTLRPFASYSFNRSHATAYAIMAYTQAYLKAHYQAEFMAALMTTVQHAGPKEKGGPKPITLGMIESKRLGYAFLPVDINASTDRIEIEPAPEGVKSKNDQAFRMSLAAISGIGARPIAAVLAEREANGPFASFPDFLTRMTSGEKEIDPVSGRALPVAVGKTAVLGLIKTGAFDAFDDRGALVARAEAYYGTTSAKKKALVDWTPVPLERRPAEPPRDYLDWERELLGFYVSAHPSGSIPPAAVAAFYDAALDREAARAGAKNQSPAEVVQATCSEALEHTTKRDEFVRVLAGLLTRVAWKPNRSGVGGKFAGIIEDESGACAFTYWQPRDTDRREDREDFARFREALPTLIGSAAAFVGPFSYDEKWDKVPGIQAYGWTPIELPRLERPEVVTKGGTPAAPAVSATHYETATSAEADEALAELFGPESAASGATSEAGGPSAPELVTPAAAVPAVSPVRDLYAKLAREYEARPTVPDLGGGVPGDRFPLSSPAPLSSSPSANQATEPDDGDRDLDESDFTDPDEWATGD